jgi:hypothetical protein
MLSPNTLLNKEKYRVDRMHLAGSLWNVYTAIEQTSGATVLIVQHGTFEQVDFPEHQGLVKIVDTFEMDGRRYEVTEPVDLGHAGTAVAKAWDEFSVVLMALNTISAVANKRCEICPQTLITTATGIHKLLPLVAVAGGAVEIEAWDVPIERIWKDLDQVSERAIYNAWGESSIADLERPLDETSDMYSVAALFYRVITGTVPPGAFERTVVSLDGSDPLVAPQALAPEIGDDAGAYLVKCLSLHRAERFTSFEEAIMSLPTLALPESAPPDEDDRDVLDLGISLPAQAVKVAETVAAKVEVMQTAEFEADEVEASPKLHIAQHTILEVPQEVEAPIFTLETTEKRGSGMKFAFAGVLMAVVGGIGWGAYQYSRSGIVAPSAVSAEITAPVIRNEPAAPTAMANDGSTVPPANVSSEVPADPAQADTSARPDATRQRQIAAKSAPKTASTTDKPKKKVTVDDLINDN